MIRRATTWFRIAGSAILAANALGCVISRPAAMPVPVLSRPPAKLTVAEPIQTVAHVEKELAAPKPVVGVTLDQVINATLLADPKLRAGFESINQAYGDALTASLKPNPQLSLNATLLPLAQPFVGSAGPPQSDLILAAPIDWFVFGKRAAAMRAAGLGVRVSESQFAELVRTRVVEAAMAYYDAVEAKALTELAQRDLDNTKQTETTMQKSVDAGVKPAIELNRVKLDRFKSETALRDAQRLAATTQAALLAVMGRTDAEAGFELAGLPMETAAIEPLSLDEALESAIRNRPDQETLRLKVEQASAAVESERRKGYPVITPQVGYTVQYQRPFNDLPNAHSYDVGITTSLPWFDRNQGNVAKASSVLAQSRFEMQAQLVALKAELVKADAEWKTATSNARSAGGEQLKLSKEVYNTVRAAYDTGKIPLDELFDAQKAYWEFERLAASSRAAAGRAAVRYSAALGKKVAP